MNEEAPIIKIKNCMYYILVGVVSMLVLIFMPMVGTQGFASTLPAEGDTSGWIMYVTSKVLVAALNVMIFYSFLKQAELNVKDNPKYIEACEMMEMLKHTKWEAKSPQKWKKQQYCSKGITITLSTIVGTVTIVGTIESYDLSLLLTYGVAIITDIIFSIISMKNAEAYWTGEFWQYAVNMKDLESKQVKKSDVKRCLMNFDKNTAKYIRREEYNRCLQLIMSNTEISKNK